MREGKIVKDDLALAIVDPEIFDAVQAILAQNAPLHALAALPNYWPACFTVSHMKLLST